MSSEQNEILLINNNNEFEVRYETFGINNDNNIEHDERAKIYPTLGIVVHHTQSNPIRGHVSYAIRVHIH